MSDLGVYRDIGVSLDENVATVEIRRPPHNFFDSDLIAEIGEAFAGAMDNDGVEIDFRHLLGMVGGEARQRHHQFGERLLIGRIDAADAVEHCRTL